MRSRNERRRRNWACVVVLALFASMGANTFGAEHTELTSKNWEKIAMYFSPPKEYAGKMGDFRSPLLFEDGSAVKTAEDWKRRRTEILSAWNKLMGEWPALLDKPAIEYLETKKREGFTQHKINVQVAEKQTVAGYLLVPPGDGPFPAVVVPFYDAETSIGLAGKPLRDFAYQLTKRGFVTLSIGSPGGDARKPDTAGHVLQPLSYLGYVGANCYNALVALPYVDAKRIGIVGHSYGGKWAMFSSCLYDKFAAAAWSDPGVVWDEARGNVNYWEAWYLGLEGEAKRTPGLVTADNPRTGAYKELVKAGRDLTELHALMAPRPFLVSGGAEDGAGRWVALNHAVAVYKLLGFEGRVGMTSRETHDPTVESNEVLYTFFEKFLGK